MKKIVNWFKLTYNRVFKTKKMGLLQTKQELENLGTVLSNIGAEVSTLHKMIQQNDNNDRIAEKRKTIMIQISSSLSELVEIQTKILNS